MAPKKRSQNQNSNNNANSLSQGRRKHDRRPEKTENNKDTPKNYKLVYIIFTVALAIAVGVLHRNHIAGMFESDRHFSHLSTLERELAFRTEMGLYFSYYKTMIRSPTFFQGLYQIMYDNITEYPSTINTLKRFNLYPEVVLAAGYRIHEGIYAHMRWPSKQCWTVNRGDGMSPVQSCEGLGEPSYFYVEAVFLLNGIMMSTFFLFGTYLSGSILGGIVTVASFFYNHGECTRVQWTPPLRESFAYPFLVIQMFLVTHSLKISRPNYKHSILIAIATVSFMLPWQFAQFALLTQTLAVFGTYALRYIGSHKVKVVVFGQMVGLFVSYLALFGNEMLLTSFFAACLLTVCIILYLEPYIEHLKNTLIPVVQGVLLILGTVGLKFAVSKILRVADDAHIGDIFRSKFTDFKNFHTQLYTCAKEFNYMEAETPGRVLKTGLAPGVLVAFSVLIFHLLKREYDVWKKNGSGKELKKETDRTAMLPIEHRSKPKAELVYHIFQLLAYTAMAIMIMRLKLFWTPHMCLFASLLASKELFGWIGAREKQFGVVAVILACMTYQGVLNIQQQRGIMGEYSNYPLEELVEWIKKTTSKTAVFAGPMPTMATVKLCTGRPIVNHPHYEDAGLRERTKKVYMVYSRKPVEEIKKNLKDLGVTHVILEDSWCTRWQGTGCGMPEVWDIEDVKNRGKQPTCQKLRHNPEPHFKRVFRNKVYDVLRIR